MKVYHIIPLNDRLTGHPENFKIKLQYFQEILSLRYNIILKLLAGVGEDGMEKIPQSQTKMVDSSITQKRILDVPKLHLATKSDPSSMNSLKNIHG